MERRDTSRIITRDDALWVFVACSQEPRHLHEIVFAISVLRRRGVPEERMLVFVDHARPEPYFEPYRIRHVFAFGELAARLARGPTSGFAIVVIGGHGAELGLVPKNAGAPFKATALYAAISAIPGVSVGVVLLTQCFGGIFHYTKADGHPALVVMGGANLNLSLSMNIELPAPLPQASGTPGLSSWAANVFAYDFFTWVDEQHDVDGDGALTVMDAFKYAGAKSNIRVRESKVPGFLAVQDQSQVFRQALDTYKQAKAAGGSPSELLVKRMTVEAAYTKLQERVEFLYSSQEPWILNARLACEVTLAL
ncbi:MAG TPA: hypothetical protein VEQ59_13720 [Polyangiaceae bacterium]|nr:hypothetical protein [Polyangiaceae bacterium]